MARLLSRRDVRGSDMKRRKEEKRINNEEAAL